MEGMYNNFEIDNNCVELVDQENGEERGQEQAVVDRIDNVSKSQMAFLSVSQPVERDQLLQLRPQAAQLQRACLEGNVVEVKKLVEQMRSTLPTLRGELLERFRFILTQALWQACECLDHSNGLKIITYLVRKGADIDLMGERGNALSICWDFEHFEGFKFLLSNGATLLTVDANGQNLIHRCCEHKAKEMLEIILDNSHPTSIACGLDVLDAAGKAPLHYAQDEDSITLLVKAGANVDVQDLEGFTPLMNACHSGNLRAVSALLDMKANVHLRCYCNEEFPEGFSAVFSALACVTREKMEGTEARKGIEILRCLFENGAKKEERCLGATPLIWACSQNDLELAIFLLDRFANPYARSTLNRANSLLILCVNSSPGISQIAELFKPFLRNLNRDCETESVPLFLAIDEQNLEMVKWLLNNGADAKILDQLERSPLERAEAVDPGSQICGLLKRYCFLNETPI